MPINSDKTHLPAKCLPTSTKKITAHSSKTLKLEEKSCEMRGSKQIDQKIPPKWFKQTTVGQEIEKEQLMQETLRLKQVLNEKECQLTSKDVETNNLKEVVETSTKEIEHLKLELYQESEEKSNYKSLIDKIETQLESSRYEINRAKTEKQELMKHYEQTIRNLSEKLALEKKEQVKIRECMARCTPEKSNSFLKQEIRSLREENRRKTEHIERLRVESRSNKVKSVPKDDQKENLKSLSNTKSKIPVPKAT